MSEVIHVDLPYACFWLEYDLMDDEPVIVKAPPIARWVIGRLAEDIADYYKRKGALVVWDAEAQ